MTGITETGKIALFSFSIAPSNKKKKSEMLGDMAKNSLDLIQEETFFRKYDMTDDNNNVINSN